MPIILASATLIFSIGDPDSDLSDLIGQSGIGYSAKSWEIDGLIKELDEFLNFSLGSSHEERQNLVKEFIKEHFGMKKLIQWIVG